PPGAARAIAASDPPPGHIVQRDSRSVLPVVRTRSAPVDQVACPRCMAVAPSGTPRCPVCSTSLEHGVRVEPEAVPVQETGWAAVAQGPTPTEAPPAVPDVAQVALPIDAFAPPPPGSPGIPLQLTPSPTPD